MSQEEQWFQVTSTTQVAAHTCTPHTQYTELKGDLQTQDYRTVGALAWHLCWFLTPTPRAEELCFLAQYTRAAGTCYSQVASSKSDGTRLESRLWTYACILG